MFLHRCSDHQDQLFCLFELKNIYPHLKFPVSRVARVKLSVKLQHSFPATLLETCQLVILLFVDWWKCSRIRKTILQQEKREDTCVCTV